MDDAQHKALTGLGNELILDNLKKLDRHGKSIWIRIPLIPGHNDSKDNLTRLAEFISPLEHVEKVSLLPFNEAAAAKYAYIGQTCQLPPTQSHTREQEQTFADIFSSIGIKVEIGR